ncbi:uncharacterized protein DS421_16g545150 [Arachis hypogaea]|nr:uncharacterized protein DS421_16g545150 [Arachis hypogaea]
MFKLGGKSALRTLQRVSGFGAANQDVAIGRLSGTSSSSHTIGVSYTGFRLKFTYKWGEDIGWSHKRSSTNYGRILLLPSEGGQEREREITPLPPQAPLHAGKNTSVTAGMYADTPSVYKTPVCHYRNGTGGHSTSVAGNNPSAL